MHISKLYKDYLIEQDNTDLGKSIADLKALCLEQMIITSQGDTRDAIQACKYLLEFNPKENKVGRGRPSREDILLETKKMVEDNNRLDQDYALYESFKE